MKRRILTIVTSDATKLKDHKTGLWLSELTHFLEAVCDAGFDYDIASPCGGKVPLDEGSATPKALAESVNERFLADPEFVKKLEASIPLSGVDANNYVALYLAGGHGTMFDFRGNVHLQKLIAAFSDSERFVTGVCHGVAGLVDVVDGRGQLIVKDKRVTGFSNFEDALAGTKSLMPFLLEDALEANGAKYSKNLVPFTSRVEIDGILITGQNPQSAKAVGEELVKRIA
jgi:putative intracellular protease/amidase